MGITVRRAHEGDIDWLMSQLRVFARFANTKHNLIGDEDFALRQLGVMVADHVVLIADDEKHGPVGFIAGYAVSHPFNPKLRVLSENFWWVPEEHRGSRAGLVLLNAFTDWGKENADMVCMALEAHSPVNDRCLLSRGYRLNENSYLLEVG